MWWAMMLAAAQTPAVEAHECEAGPAEVLVGERYRRHVPTRAKRLSGAGAVRVVFPGQAVTQDFRPDRITIQVDHQRRISDVRCG